jgi:tetratricopeptide (TPR) repeat protein
MKINRMVCFSIFFIIILNSCGVNQNYIKKIQSMEEGVSSPTTIDELTSAITKYERRVEDIMLAQQSVGIWYKILATRYIDKQMYGEALAALQKAIMYYPANQNLYYYVGVCAGYMAKAELDFSATGSSAKKQNYLRLSESGYLRAIELEPNYARSLYGLAVLYVFDLDESNKAIPLLEKLLTIEKRHVDAMFVLARAYYVDYQFEKAVEIYDLILSTTGDSQKTADAQMNKKIVLDAQYAQ